MRVVRRQCFCMGALLCAFAASGARAANEEEQVWISNTLVAEASKRDTIIMSVGQRFRPPSAGGDQQVAYTVLEHSFDKHFQMGAMGYYRSDPEQELRLYEQVTFERGPWSSRTRLEERYLSPLDKVSWRLRQRIRFVKPIDRDEKWNAIAMTEYLFHMNAARPTDKTGLAVSRYMIGVNRALTKNLALQFIYMRQRTFRTDAPDTIAHIPWMTVRWSM